MSDTKPETSMIGWECPCGEEFVGEFQIPSEDIEEHIKDCPQSPEMIKDVMSLE